MDDSSHTPKPEVGGVKQKPLWHRLLLAVVFLAAASGIRAFFFPDLGRGVPYLTYYPATMLAALFGGLAAGLLATAVSVALVYFWILRGLLGASESLAMLGFVSSCILLSFVVRALRQAQERATQAAERYERQRAEEKIRAHEESYRNLFEHMNGGIAYCQMIDEPGQAKDFVYLEVNPKFTTLTGLKDVVGKRASAVIPGLRENDPELLEAYGRVAATGKPERFERFVESLQVWFDISAYSTKTGFFVAVFEVITERKQAELALHESELLLRQVIDLVPHHIFAKDRHGHFLFLNRATAKACGHHQPQEMIGCLERELLPGKPHVEQILRDDQEVIASGKPKFIPEESITYADGSVHFLQTTKIPFTPPGGTEQGVLGVAVDITERKRVEAELELFRTLVDQANDSFMVIDPETGRLLDVNEQGYQARGYSREEFLALRVFDIDPTLRPDEFRRINEELRTNNGLVWHGLNRCKDGSTFPVEVNLKYVRLDRDYVVADVRDITERQRAEAALRESEAKYRSLNTSMTEGMALHELICDAAGQPVDYVLLDVNPAFEKVTGRSRDSVIGRRASEVYGGEAPFLEVYARVATTGRPVNFETAYEPMKKTFRISVFSPATGRFATVFSDITERQRAEAALQESEADFRAMFELASIGMAQTNPYTGQWLRVNQAMCEITGYSADELLRMQITDITLPEDRQPDEEAFQRVVWGEQPNYRMEKRYRRKDGTVVWVNVNMTILRNPAGQPTRTMATIEDITERKTANAALRQSEAKYRDLFECSRDALLRLDPATRRFTSVNPSTVRIFGAKNEAELIGHRPEEFSPERQPDGRLSAEKAKEIDELVLRKGTHYFEWTHRRISGEEFLADVLLARIEVDGIATILATVRDITERKQAESALKEKERLLSEAQVIANMGSYETDFSLGRWSSSAVLDQVFGIGPTFDRSVAGWASLIHPADRAMMVDYLEQEVIGRRQPFNKEYRIIRHNDQAERWVNGLGKMEFDPQGRPLKMVGTIQDITERKRAEESHTRLAMAVEQAAETIVITDTEGTILYVNPALEKTTGYTRAEALGQNPRLFKSGKQDAEFYRRMWETLEHGETWSGHFINKRKDGTLYEEEATLSPVRDATGKVINYVAVKRDVTREVELEGQMRQVQKMEAIGKLAGGVAHDFNNILAIISMQASLLKSGGGLSAAQLNFADEIGTTVDRAAALTRQLLLFSHREALQLRDLDLSETVTHTTKLLRRILGETIKVQLNLAAEPMFIHADTGMMDQVLLNLAVNARDAMLQGGRLVIETTGVELDELAVAQCLQARPGSFVCLSVSDTGTGIPPEVMPRIFEPFFTTKGVGKGTGLGLATVFGIVQHHQGWINVETQAGQGTTFKVYLPRLVGMNSKIIAQKMLTTVPSGKETILLVEDEPALRASVSLTLTRLGYRVLEAATGNQALKVWQKKREAISLLLTDMVMPDGLNGKELSQRLLQDNPKLKVIYMSGYSADVMGRDFPLPEEVNFLTKPFPAHKLAQTIRETLDKPA